MEVNPRQQPPAKGSMFECYEAARESLIKSGFPRRHIEMIEKMHGAGLDRAKELEATVTSGDCLLVLCGDRGPGKTQMATYWASKVRSSRYFRTRDLMDAIRGKFSDIKELENESYQTLKHAKQCSLLVLDEYSEVSGTDYERETLTNLIDYRYGDKKSTVIISNTSVDRAPGEVGRSAWSRAEETGGIVVCDWPSYRNQSTNQ
jgi:DNA replication protein DnaC